MLLKISHTTRYLFDSPARYGLQQLRVTPKSRDNQKVLNWQVTLTGATQQATFEDQNNNTVILASIDENASEVLIESGGEVEVQDTSGVIGQHGGFAPLWYFRRETTLTKPGKEIRKLVRELTDKLDGTNADDLSKMHALSKVIGEKVSYRPGTTDAGTTAENAVIAGSGVCQDHAHIMIAAARYMGLPARYVGGYLMMNDRVEQEAGHAWAEVYVDKLGWVGFDISNDICPDARYVRVATGLDYTDAAPVSGMRFAASGGEMDETMLVNISVQQ